jgi:hypothetical protein
MNRVTTLVAGLAALTVISTAAEAAQGCGKGYHYNGTRCVPQGGPDHRQPYHSPKGSSAGLGDTGYRSHRPLRGSSADLGDDHRPSYRHRGSSADLGDDYGPSHRRHGYSRGLGSRSHRLHHGQHGISVDLGPIGRLHFHHGGSRSRHLDED